jgi:hypothetical protein
VVESTRLESERTGNRTVGSNPSLSAIVAIVVSLQYATICHLIYALD